MHYRTIIHSAQRTPTNPTQCAACGASVHWPRDLSSSDEMDVTCNNPDCDHVTTFLVTDSQVTGVIP